MGKCIKNGRKLIKGECQMCNWLEKYFRCAKIVTSNKNREKTGGV